MPRRNGLRAAGGLHTRPLRQRMVLVAVLGALQSGCSIISPMPVWELAKATGSLATMAIQSEPGQASDTVYHAHQPFPELCIEFNPQTQVADMVPALQTALRSHHIESRVYEGAVAGQACQVWLRYSAQIDWDRPPMTERFQSFVSTATLSLQTAQGRVLSSSHYVLEPGYGTSKWASTHDKLEPVVAALVTGVVPERRSSSIQKGNS